MSTESSTVQPSPRRTSVFRNWLSLAGLVIIVGSVFSFALLLFTLLQANDADAPLAKAVKRGHKGVVTVIAYALAIALALRWPMAAVAIYVVVALIWLIPDRRFEQFLE